MAVVLVLGRHLTPCPDDESVWLHRVTEIWHRGGWVGVDLFFVLSGFLVSGLLFREHERHGEIKAGRFLIRRGFKIYPAFWTLILATVAMYALKRQPVPIPNLLAEILFVQNYWLGFWQHTWSLAVEEHFYLLLALLLLGLTRTYEHRPFRHLPVLFAFVAVGCLSWRSYLAYGTAYDDRVHLFPTHLRLDSLFFGVLLGYWQNCHQEWFSEKSRSYRLPALLVGSLLLSLPFVFDLQQYSWMVGIGLTLCYLGSGLILVGTLALDAKLTGAWNPLAFIGRYSYSIYLWHLPVQFWFVPIVLRISGKPDSWITEAIAYLLGALWIGITMAAIVESPAIALRDRLFPSRSSNLDSTRNDLRGLPS